MGGGGGCETGFGGRSVGRASVIDHWHCVVPGVNITVQYINRTIYSYIRVGVRDSYQVRGYNCPI